MGQLALSLGGAAAGNFLLPGLGAQIGFGLGAYAGGLLFNDPIESRGPRIQDAQVTTSAYGALIPTVWGVYPVAGNIIDASPVREVKNEEEAGKGAPSSSVTTYSYFGDLDVVICAGEVQAILQIRANGRVIFDASPTAEVVKPDWLDFKLYPGNETQLPDPTMESVHGAGNVPGSRGVAHVVFSDFPFTQFNNSFAINFEFLVAVASSSGTTLQDTQVSVTGEDSQYAGAIEEASTGLLIFPINSTATQTYGLTAVDPYSRSVVWQSDADGKKSYASVSMKPRLETVDGQTIAVPGELYAITGNSSDITYFQRLDAVSGEILATSPAKSSTGSYVRVMVVDWYSGNIHAEPYWIRDRGVFNGYDFFHGFDDSTAIEEIDGWYFTPSLTSDGAGQILVSVADAETAPTNQGVTVLDTEAETFSAVAVTGAISAAVRGNGSWWVQTAASPAVIKEISDAGAILQTINFSTDYSISATLNDGIVYNPSENALFMQGNGTLYKLRLGLLELDPVTYAVGPNSPASVYHPSSGRIWYGPNNNVDAHSANLFAASGQVAGLDDVVSDLSIDGTALLAADIDVTALATIDVRGLAVATPMARRNVLALLQNAYLFDYVPRAADLTAVLRGGPSAATLTAAHIGAYIDGGTRPVPWTIRRTPAASLPDQLEVTFVDPDHNYEAATQLARRQGTAVGTTERLNLPLVLSNDEAAQIAETLLHLRHINAEQYQTTTMPSTIDDVQAGAVLTTTYDGVDYVYRAVEASIIDGRMLSLIGQREVPEVFTQYAVGGSPRTVDGRVQALGHTVLWPLDIPLLRTQDDNAGAYLAGASFTPGWPGAEIQRSGDGVTYTSVTTLTDEASMGSVINAPGGVAGYWDTDNTLTVRLIAGSLTSTNRDAPSYAAWGAAGRWEIIAYTTAVQGADGDWTVSEIARGLHGSDHAVAVHATSDQFVELSAATLGRIVFPASSIDQIEQLRPITIGRTAASAIPIQFTFSAECLAPYAPTRLDGSIDGSSNWDLAWMRQDRLHGRAFWAPANAEASETYTVRILDDLDNVVRTATVTDASVYEYTLAFQNADFGTALTVVRWDVAQVSALTGDGHRATAAFGVDYDYPGTIVSDAPVAYYRLDETSGSTATDEIASLDGTYTGTPSLGDAPLFRTGKAVGFDGVSDYIAWDTSGESSSWATGLELAFNVTAFPAAGYEVIWCHENDFSPSLSAYLVVGSDSKLRLYLYGTSSTLRLNLAGATISTGTDYHVIINWGYGAASNADIYLNDTTYASGSNSGTWQMDTSNNGLMHVGYSDEGTHGKFHGTVDDLSLWGSTQSSAQRTDHFNRGGIA